MFHTTDAFVRKYNLLEDYWLVLCVSCHVQYCVTRRAILLVCCHIYFSLVISLKDHTCIGSMIRGTDMTVTSLGLHFCQIVMSSADAIWPDWTTQRVTSLDDGIRHLSHSFCRIFLLISAHFWRQIESHDSLRNRRQSIYIANISCPSPWRILDLSTMISLIGRHIASTFHFSNSSCNPRRYRPKGLVRAWLMFNSQSKAYLSYTTQYICAYAYLSLNTYAYMRICVYTHIYLK